MWTVYGVRIIKCDVKTCYRVYSTYSRGLIVEIAFLFLLSGTSVSVQILIFDYSSKYGRSSGADTIGPDLYEGQVWFENITEYVH